MSIEYSNIHSLKHYSICLPFKLLIYFKQILFSNDRLPQSPSLMQHLVMGGDFSSTVVFQCYQLLTVMCSYCTDSNSCHANTLLQPADLCVKQHTITQSCGNQCKLPVNQKKRQHNFQQLKYVPYRTNSGFNTSRYM